MADNADDLPGKDAGGEDRADRADGGGGAAAGRAELTEAQRLVLERCIRALNEAKKDSQTLAALLLITRLCPANDLDKDTLRRIFEAVGLSLPARLLVTAYRRSDSSSLSPLDVLALGTALLAALSTDPDMATHPQLLTTVPILLGLVANGPVLDGSDPGGVAPPPPAPSSGGCLGGCAAAAAAAAVSEWTGVRLDGAMAADCYQVLVAVCAGPQGPDHLLRRGAVVTLCQAVHRDQTLSREQGLPLLAGLLSGKTRDRVWGRHCAELLGLLLRLCRDFCQASPEARLDSCAQLVQFMPPPAVAARSRQLREATVQMWGSLRPMVQSRMTAQQIGPVLVLGACLLDLYGWQPVGPPNFCCLLVNRACVEVRVGLEGPPGTEIGSQLQQTLAGCYRIMEAAFEQACCQRDAEPGEEGEAAAAAASGPSLSLQQSRQVFKVLEGGFAALMYHLQQVDASRYNDPFVFATFRCVCVWLAEETSCLKEEVTELLPFLVGYARAHLQSGDTDQQLADWMELMAVDKEQERWSGQEALRYLLPALCHLSAEDGPRRVLLALDTPALLVDFLSRSWSALRETSRTAADRNPSMEALCSALLNFTVTEPDRVRSDPSFRALEAHVSDALPSLVSKPGLLVLAVNYCTLGLMMARLKTAAAGPMEARQRRFFSVALRFLRGALDSSAAPGPVQLSASWKDSWYEVAELWRLSLQALGGCVAALPGVAALLREDGWLRHVLDLLGQCSALPDPQTQAALEEALCAAARLCAACREETREAVEKGGGALGGMSALKKTLG